MSGFSFKSSWLPLLLLVAVLFLGTNSQAAQEKSPLWSWIKPGSLLSSVNRKGGSRSGGGSRGGSIGGGRSRGGGWKGGKSGGGRVPVYAAGGAAGAAGATAGVAASGPHYHRKGAGPNGMKPSPINNLALPALLSAIALFFFKNVA